MPDFIVPFVITVFKFHIQTRQGDCRLTTSLWAAPFNITMVQVYAPTSDYDDNKIEEFYDQLQNGIDQTPKKNTLLVQGDWNAKVGKDAGGNWEGICGPFCKD